MKTNTGASFLLFVIIAKDEGPNGANHPPKGIVHIAVACLYFPPALRCPLRGDPRPAKQSTGNARRSPMHASGRTNISCGAFRIARRGTVAADRPSLRERGVGSAASFSLRRTDDVSKPFPSGMTVP